MVGQANYGAAKMGLVGLTRVLAVEGARYNIQANAIAPLALTRMTEDIMGRLGEKLDPALVSPIVTYLAHESCDATGRIFSVGGGRVAEVFVAEVPGFYKPDLSPEDVADNWAAVTEHEGYSVPRNLGEETGLFVSAFKA
jgi:NAD(P)-dependent dehydrogenase (short-subunit alcohol dehydrogenase family)